MPIRSPAPFSLFGKVFSPATVSGLVGDYSPGGARVLTATDYAAVFSSSSLASSNSSLLVSPTNGFTICMWVYWNTSAGSYTLAQSNGSGGGFTLDTVSGGRLLVYNSSNTLIGNVNVGFTTVNGQWLFLAATINIGAATATVRVNRLPSQSVSLSGSPAAGTAAFKIGNGSSGAFTGSIAGLAVAQQVLTSSDIDQLFGSPGGVTYAGLTSALQAKLSEFWGFGSGPPFAGSKSSISLAATGTVTQGPGPACVAPTTNGQSITWWLDNSTARNDLFQFTSANQPSYVAAANALTGRNSISFPVGSTAGITSGYSGANLATYSTQSLTIAAVSRAQYRSGINQAAIVGIPGLAKYAQLFTFTEYYSFLAVGAPQTTEAYPNQMTRYADIRIMTLSATAAALNYNQNSQLTTTAPSATAAAGLTIGYSPNSGAEYAGSQDIERICVYNTPISSASITYLLAGLRNESPFPIVSTTLPVVFFCGNSIFYGGGTTAVVYDMPTVIAAALSLSQTQWFDFSIDGQRTTQDTASDPAKLAPYYSVTRPGTYVCFTEITNDIFLFAVTGSQAYVNVKAWLAAVFAVLPNAKIVITTCLPRGTGDSAARDTCNSLLQADFTGATAYSHVWTGTASYNANVVLADWASDPNMGQNNDNLNTTYYAADQIHPNNNGNTILGPYVSNALIVAGI